MADFKTRRWKNPKLCWRKMMKQIDKKGKESDLLAGDDVRFYFLNCGI